MKESFIDMIAALQRESKPRRVTLVLTPSLIEKDMNQVGELMYALRRGKVLSAKEKADWSEYLGGLYRRLSRLAVASSPKRGRAKDPQRIKIAMHYLVQKELLGAAKKAVYETAEVWRKNEKYVRDCVTKCRKLAEGEIALFVNGGLVRGESRQQRLNDILTYIRPN